MSAVVLRCELINIVKNYDGTMTYYFKDTETGTYSLIQNMQKVVDCQQNSPNGIKVEICKWVEQRSLDANAYFHVLVDKIAKATNKGNEEVKKNLNLDYGTIMLDKKGLKVGIKLPVDVNVDDVYQYAKWFDVRNENGRDFNCYILYKPTHTLTKTEMKRLIDGTIQEAQNLGIETRTPEEIKNMLNLYEQGKKNV